MQLETQQYTELLTVAEVARRLRVDSTTVRRWLRQGSLPAVLLPHKGTRQSYRVRADTLQQVLDGSAKP